MATATLTSARPGTTLHGVPWGVYLTLRELPDNDRLRMTYLDGTLILVSPEYIHDRSGWFLNLIVVEVAVAFALDIVGAGSTTFRRGGNETNAGVAKEPDESYYIGANEVLMRDKDEVDLDVDPPPDLAIEVENKSDSSLALPTYAGLLVPELWRYDAREHTLWFGRLVDGGYVPIERSVNLPMLTPELVLHALEKTRDLGGAAGPRWLRDWAAALPGAHR